MPNSERAGGDDLGWLSGEPDSYIAEVVSIADDPAVVWPVFDDHPVGECRWCDALRIRRDRRERNG